MSIIIITELHQVTGGDVQNPALAQAAQLLKALNNIQPGATQSALLRPGTVDFAELISQMQQLQSAQQGGSGSAPDLAADEPDDKKAQASMPPPSTIPVKAPKQQDVMPATRPGSPAPPSLADRAGPPTVAAEQAQVSLAEAAKQIQAGWERLYRYSKIQYS